LSAATLTLGHDYEVESVRSYQEGHDEEANEYLLDELLAE